MAVNLDQDGAEDVNDFLQRIRELGDKREREDQDRTRKLEEEILQGRKERQARRAERARSLSPTKDSPSNTPQSTRSTGIDTPTRDDPPTQNMESAQLVHPPFRDDHPVNTPEQPPIDRSVQSHSKSSTSPTTGGPSTSIDVRSTVSPSAAVAPSRGSPLSWQRRPTSQASNLSLNRHSSVMSAKDVPPKSPNVSPDLAGEPSRIQIMQSLGSKDPTWFRQTEDRGVNSAAYRRQEAEETGLASRHDKTQLPGLSDNSRTVRENGAARSPSPSEVDSFRDTTQLEASQSSISSARGAPRPMSRSPLPMLSSQRFEPPESALVSSQVDSHCDDVEQMNALAMSPSQGRISPERTDRAPSPTKGLGGFVQSAMLKRSDSVNKRWSVQSNTGLSRENSVIGSRPGNGSGAHSGTRSPTKHDFRPSSMSRESSPALESRPGSSHSIANLAQASKENERPNSSSGSRPLLNGTFAIPSRPGHSRSPSVVSVSEQQQHPTERSIIGRATPPSSPSKSSDMKRWSPTKASWLESAINKPSEAPKPKTSAPQQLSWMADINKAKAQRGSVDLGRAHGHREVNTTGLMRAPPPGAGSNSSGVGALSPPIGSESVKKDVLSSPDGSQVGVGSKNPPFVFESNSTSRPASHAPPKGQRTLPSSESEKTLVNSTAVSPKRNGSPTTTRLSPSASDEKSPAIAKKPATPPKKDFQSILKSRQQMGDKKSIAEPEFKNVFGNLKRTKTQNYVAPDELKSNILRGKAALNLTGGPKPSDRKDEFKETLLKQKEAMKSKGEESKSWENSTSPGSTRSKNEDPSVMPEALAKRGHLTRTTSTSKASNSAPSAAPEAISLQKTIKDKPKMSPPRKEPSAPGRLQGIDSVGPSKLAERFKPALASVLARGPPARADGKMSSRQSDANGTQAPTTHGVPNRTLESPSQGNLTHMTKARAKGPKRRLPTSKQGPTDSQPSQERKVQLEATGTKGNTEEVSSLSFSIDDNDSRKDVPTTREPNIKSVEANPATSEAEAITREGESNGFESKGPSRLPPVNEGKGIHSPLSSNVDTGFNSWSLNPQSPEHTTHDGAVNARPDPIGQQRTPRRSSLEKPETFGSPTHAKIPTPRSSPLLHRSEPPVKPVKRKDSNPSIQEKLSRSTPSKPKAPIGLGLQDVPEDKKASDVSNTSQPSPPTKFTQSPPTSAGLPPTPGKKPRSLSGRDFSNGVSATNRPLESPIPHTSEAHHLFADFFDIIPKSSARLNVDTQAILTSKHEHGGKIKTLRKQIWTLSGDGKQHSVPSHREHILFENDMYLCTHVFGSTGGTRTTEVYLWVGNDVPAATVEDAQLFARRVAKENSGKLITLKQGRETSNFFQALGGIVITRRGSSSRADSSSPFMLCSRRHVDQIAFDEVDLSPRSLCAGFPYLLSSSSGKLFLWKGRGSSADELGCARLIGMDLGATGEVEEVEEGQESAAFLDAFGPGAKKSGAPSAEYWRHKPTCEHYATRLFCIDESFANKVVEISPFTQSDLDPSHIYLVDAFFSIYILLPAQATSKFPSFHTALLFAQDYGILAASIEDRPFVPVSQVAVRGVPAEVRNVFRRWDEGAARRVGFGEGDKDGLVVVPLAAAIEATRG